MGLAAADEAAREAWHGVAQYGRAMERLASEATRYARRLVAQAADVRTRSHEALPGLIDLAMRHPHLFDVSGAVPMLKGVDPEPYAVAAHEARRRDAVYFRLALCDDAIAEVEEILSQVADDHAQRPFFLLWREERQRERKRLQAEFRGEGCDADGFTAWKAAHHVEYRQLQPRAVSTPAIAVPADLLEEDLPVSEDLAFDAEALADHHDELSAV
jgi:hypothetical protein